VSWPQPCVLPVVAALPTTAASTARLPTIGPCPITHIGLPAASVVIQYATSALPFAVSTTSALKPRLAFVSCHRPAKPRVIVPASAAGASAAAASASAVNASAEPFFDIGTSQPEPANCERGHRRERTFAQQ